METIEEKAQDYALAHNSNPNRPYCPEGELNRRLKAAYLAGAAEALRSQWISVEDDLPEEDEVVIAEYYAHWSYSPTFATYSKEEGWSGYMGYPINPICWMRIPKLPDNLPNSTDK